MKKVKKKLTTKEQFNNAVKWIDALKVSVGYKKGRYCLGEPIKGYVDFKDVVSPKTEMKFCCLGVACREMGHNKIDYPELGLYPKLKDELGLFAPSGSFKSKDGYTFLEVNGESAGDLVAVNDTCYGNDENFINVRKTILDNIDMIFIPPVAKLLKTHYKRK